MNGTDARTPHDQTSSTPDRAERPARSVCASRPARCEPVDELIRFVVGPDGTGPRPQAQAAGPRRLDHGDTGNARATRSRARCSPAASSATCGWRRTSWTVTKRLLERAVARRARHRRQGRPGGGRIRQGRGGAGPRRGRRRCCMPPMPVRTGCASSRRRSAPHGRDGDQSPSSRYFTSAQLDLALGRSNVVHAALLAGPASDTFLARLPRLERFRTGEHGSRGRPRARATELAGFENWND